MPIYAIVEDDGTISRVHSTPDLYVEASPDVTDATHYYDRDSREIREKLPAEVSASVDGLTITLVGVPVGALVDIRGHRQQAESDTLTVEVDAPGQYDIRVHGVPRYLDAALTVEV
ncbi:hypothetical protein GY26_15945 [Gammaproteobacteria bacterium MFB021]|nr:hypothetical protein GY26_15945 [Gammaproteobacteria bacterium MFB021]